MVIDVHTNGPQFWSLGLVRVHESMPAQRCIQFIRHNLKSFGLDLNSDIVDICTDRASVMYKVGKLISAQHQLCYAHGVQLASYVRRYDHDLVTNCWMPCDLFVRFTIIAKYEQ
jgi:hypothetical protein